MSVLTYLIAINSASTGASGPGYLWQHIDATDTVITHTHITVDASTEDINIELLAASAVADKGDFVIKRVDSNTANVVNIVGTIDGDSSIQLLLQYDCIKFSSNGTDYLEIP